jgi:hypothetical protein
VRRCIAYLLVWAVVLWPGAAMAQHTVAIVLAGGSGPELAPFELRLRSELLAAGFSVASVQVPSAPDADALQRAATGMPAKSAIAILLSDQAVYGFVWAAARADDRTLIRPIHPVPLSDDAPTVFAIRATELLNAVLIELGYPRRSPSDATPPPEPAPPAAAPPPPKPPPKPLPKRPPAAAEPGPPTWSIAAGAGLLGGPGGIRMGAAPALALSRRLLGPWSVEALVSGPFLGTVFDRAGRAAVDQEVGVLRVRLDGRPTVAFGVVGAGVYRLGVSGHADPGYSSTSDDIWCALMLAGVGANLPVVDQLSFRVETDLAVTIPRPQVLFAGHAAAHTGLPLLLAALSLGYAW